MIHDAPNELHNMLNRVYHELKAARVAANKSQDPKIKLQILSKMGNVDPISGDYPLSLVTHYGSMHLILSEVPKPMRKQDEEPKQTTEKQNN